MTASSLALKWLLKEYRDIADNPNHEFYACPMEVRKFNCRTSH